MSGIAEAIAILYKAMSKILSQTRVSKKVQKIKLAKEGGSNLDSKKSYTLKPSENNQPKKKKGCC